MDSGVFSVRNGDTGVQEAAKEFQSELERAVQNLDQLDIKHGYFF